MKTTSTHNPSPAVPAYRRVLREQLAEKARTNPAFSLRAFARKSGVSHALLSQVVNEKKHLSRATAIRVAEHLGLTPERREQFLDLVEYETSSDDRYRVELLQRMQTREPQNESLVLTMEMLRVVADWYHFPILELTSLDEFDGKPRTIARMLGISELEARVAIDRLVSLGLIEQSDGCWRKTRAFVTTTNGTPSRPLREHHRQMIAKANDAIEGQTVDRRYLTDMTIAIDRQDIEEVGRRLERFKEELSRFLNRRSRRNAVYQLNLQFFDLMKTPNALVKKGEPQS